MKKRALLAAAVIALFAFLSVSINAQQSETKNKKALRVAGKIAMATLKAGAKMTYETGKVIGRQIVIPFAKNVVIPVAKEGPPLTVKAVKLSAKGVKNAAKAIKDRTGDEQTSKSADGN